MSRMSKSALDIHAKDCARHGTPADIIARLQDYGYSHRTLALAVGVGRRSLANWIAGRPCERANHRALFLLLRDYEKRGKLKVAK